ncbi:probable 26S proteasome non-ATPase regulatory subunit 3 [Teleopsis dalmanni]|uniref:probable 26S proteasome non-ATPase regulatory subunit 3 n=1 Tax=Teleopsis dalmanni TaxID=139649 RepID=UPI0018CCEE75|nr:probable 26S proteasome non-ATPase regulatory subunit 3 [Teleopsis dalmanni]
METVKPAQVETPIKPIENESEPMEVDNNDFDSVIRELKEHVQLIEKGAETKETRFVVRVIRLLPRTRRLLNLSILRQIATLIYPPDAELQEVLGLIPTTVPEVSTKFKRTIPRSPIPHIDVYYHLLLLMKLIDEPDLEKALICGTILNDKIIKDNSPTMQLLAARAYYYFARASELNDTLSEIRPFLLLRLRTATLHKNQEVQAVLINCLLHNYLHYSLYEQADKLIKQTIFPVAASNNQLARYLFYNGRIKLTKLEYTEGHKQLIRAQRKAPQSTALGFRQIVQKYIIVVELLLGSIPERTIYNQPGMKEALLPYLKLTQTVRLGNLKGFGAVMEKYGNYFQDDHTYMLISRLRQSVIKTALRQISMAYSRISLADVAQRLLLDSIEDAEFIVAKAISDGVIEGIIDCDGACLCSKESQNVYKTREPQIAFHERIAFCLNLHNEAVRALRFPKTEKKKQKTAVEKAIQEEQELEAAVEEFEEF